jgi:hypothetical protein
MAERIVVRPSTKSGILAVKAAAYDACGHLKNAPQGRSCVKLVVGAGFDTDSPDSWEW